MTKPTTKHEEIMNVMNSYYFNRIGMFHRDPEIVFSEKVDRSGMKLDVRFDKIQISYKHSFGKIFKKAEDRLKVILSDGLGTLVIYDSNHSNDFIEGNWMDSLDELIARMNKNINDWFEKKDQLAKEKLERNLENLELRKEATTFTLVHHFNRYYKKDIEKAVNS